MASRNQPISSLNPMQHRDTTVKVRVVRLWCVLPYSSNTSKPNPGDVAIQIVLCDSENCTIGASVPSMYLNKFKGAFVEGGVYFISRFGDGGSRGNFRITTHVFKINFQFGTSVMPTVDDPNIHKFGFDWVTAESIASGNADEKTQVDIIGLLTNIGDVIQSSKDDASSKRVTIEIEDRARSRVSATLWGRYCDQIEKFMNKHKEGPVVIALQYCKTKVFNGHRSLSNSMHATRVLSNEDLKDFRGLHDQVSGTNLKSPLIGSSSSSVKYVSRYADPFNSVSLSCISELLLSVDESVHCIIGSVLKVNTDKAWFYNSCTKCKRKVEEDGESFYCNYCSAPMSTAIPRFRIEMVVIDDSALANFTVFDRDAANFLGLTAEFMKNKAEKVDDDSMHSLAEFDKFLGIRFVFKVGVKLATWSPTPLLTIQAMSWDQDLIKKLSTDSALDVVATEHFGDTNICSSNSQDVTGVEVSSQNLTPNVEVVKNNIDNETANPRYDVEGRSLSFSEEVTSEDRVTTSSSMGNSSEETANPRYDVEGRSLSFSEEVTSEDRVTTSSSMGNSSEDSNNKRRAYDFNEVNTVSLDVIKKVKLEKL
ncbi:replication protein A 70 kDa DNA-binding subunit C-like [Senna tora]|uniref:Replication protein A 70 kDa DNA-binding subunit C-like n=1 Tax=Senna tora TaxID=362788 RepID=A0A834W6U7_9FABA|nr:replication protein A 70 kDa DNA-binding subunit C-like [Senna tora]